MYYLLDTFNTYINCCFRAPEDGVTKCVPGSPSRSNKVCTSPASPMMVASELKPLETKRRTQTVTQIKPQLLTRPVATHLSHILRGPSWLSIYVWLTNTIIFDWYKVEHKKFTIPGDQVILTGKSGGSIIREAHSFLSSEFKGTSAKGDCTTLGDNKVCSK